MKFAVRVRWPEGHWTYVTTERGDEPQSFNSWDEATRAAAPWIVPGREMWVQVVELGSR